MNRNLRTIPLALAAVAAAIAGAGLADLATASASHHPAASAFAAGPAAPPPAAASCSGGDLVGDLTCTVACILAPTPGCVDCTTPANPACVCGLPGTPPCPAPNPCVPQWETDPCVCNPSPPFVPACHDPCKDVPIQAMADDGGPHCGKGCGQNPEPAGCDTCLQHHTPDQCAHCAQHPDDAVCDVECDAASPPAYCRPECYNEPSPPYCNDDCRDVVPTPPHCRPECPPNSTDPACQMCSDWMYNPDCNPCTGTYSDTPCPEQCRVQQPPSWCRRGVAPGSTGPTPQRRDAWPGGAALPQEAPPLPVAAGLAAPLRR